MSVRDAQDLLLLNWTAAERLKSRYAQLVIWQTRQRLTPTLLVRVGTIRRMTQL